MDRLVRKILREINAIDSNDDIMNILKRVDEIYLTYFQHILDSQNQNVEFAEENVKKYQAIITPIDIAGERLGTLFIYKADEQ